MKEDLIRRIRILRARVEERAVLKIIASVLLVLGIIAGAYLVQRGYRYFTGAVTDPVELYFTPSVQNLPPDSQFSLVMDAHNNEINFARIEFDFDHTIVNLVNEINTTPSMSTVVEKTSKAEANSTGHVVIVLGLSPGDPAPTNVFEVANFELTAIDTESISTDLLFDVPSMQIVTANVEEVPHSSITARPARLELNQVLSGARLLLELTSSNPGYVGGSQVVNLVVDTDGEDISGVDAKINFNPSVTGVTDIAPLTTFSSFPSTEFDNTAGTISIAANIGTSPNATPVNGNVTIASITFTHKAPSTGTDVVFDFTSGNRNDSNVVQYNTSPDSDPVDILESVVNATMVINATTPVPTESPSPVPTATAMPTSTPSATATPFYWPGDINRDGIVNIIDYSAIFSNWRSSDPNPPETDINGDGIVNIIDYSVIFTNWRKES